MNRTLAKIVSLPGTVIHSLVIPLFAFLFTLYYQPRMEYDILSMPHSSFAFNVTILFCIVLGSVLLSRFSLYALGRYRSISGKYYILWCAGELMLTALFSSLYIVLMSRGKLAFFETAGMAYLSLLATAVYSYVILWLCFERHLRNIRTTITLQLLVRQAKVPAEQSILQTQSYMPMVPVTNILLLPVSAALGIRLIGWMRSLL